MGISENAAYLKGLAEGMEFDGTTKEGKVIVKLLDLVGEMAEKIELLERNNEELFSYIEEIDEDLGELEEEFFGADDADYSDLNDDEEFAYTDEDDYYEIECPSCGEKICFTYDIDIEELICPSCGERVGDTDVIGCDDDCDDCDGCE